MVLTQQGGLRTERGMGNGDVHLTHKLFLTLIHICLWFIFFRSSSFLSMCTCVLSVVHAFFLVGFLFVFSFAIHAVPLLSVHYWLVALFCLTQTSTRCLRVKSYRRGPSIIPGRFLAPQDVLALLLVSWLHTRCWDDASYFVRSSTCVLFFQDSK